jgi:hypothetical protein
MFLGDVALRGQEGTIAWGYHTAAVFRSWVVRRTPQGGWTLSAQLQRADAFQLRQRDLKFTAPRVGGFFCWPVIAVVAVNASTFAAHLGPPEH